MTCEWGDFHNRPKFLRPSNTNSRSRMSETCCHKDPVSPAGDRIHAKTRPTIHPPVPWNTQRPGHPHLQMAAEASICETRSFLCALLDFALSPQRLPHESERSRLQNHLDPHQIVSNCRFGKKL